MGPVNAKILAALSYIEQGWPVFILGKEKTPLPNCEACRPENAGPNHDRENCACLWCHGFYAATLDPERITRMIEGRPDGMLALRLGGVSCLMAIDAESTPGKGQFAGITGLDVLDTWDTWVDGEWTLPTTLRQRTGKGGLHLVYRIPANTKVSSHNRVFPQVDIKAEFGYIAVWSGGSGLDDGRKWLDPLNAASVADATPQMLAWLADVKGKSIGGKGGSWGAVLGGDEYKEALKNGPDAGQREGFFARLSFDCFSRGMKRADVEALMFEHWQRCEQPLGDEFPWHWVEYKIQRDSVNITPLPPVPAWLPSTAGLGDTAVAIATETSVDVISSDPGRPDLFFHFSDTGLGERYAKRMRDVARYNPVTKMWYVWNGAHWIEDTYGRALLWTKEIVKDIYVEAATYTGDDEEMTDRLMAFARDAESMTKRQAMLKAASLEECMVVQPEHFDANPWVLVVRNGTIDLKTRTLRKSLPEDLNTKFANVHFDASAKAPKWLAHVEFLTMGDKVLAAYLQRVAGYTLTGLINEQKFFFFEGKGANGKNVFIEPLLEMMGSYGLRGSTALITGGDEQHPTIIMQLMGKRMVFVDEAKQGKALNVERIKELTGSTKLNARGMNKDFTEFVARLKLFIAGNNHPKIVDNTDGTWRRMQRIMCKNKVAGDDIIKDYARILFEEEASGILNWCLEGLQMHMELGGLATPQSVLDSVAEYRSEEDLIGLFLDEVCLLTGSDEDWLSVDDAYTQYQFWAASAGLKGADLYNKITFAKMMATKDLVARQKKINGVNARRYAGLRLLKSIPTFQA
jgi:putative DNA primase/helicase